VQGLPSSETRQKSEGERTGVISLDDESAFYEVALIPLPPELEAAPDVEVFAAMPNFGNPCWVPIRGKSIDIEGIPMILHAGYPADEGEWRVSSIQAGYKVVDDDDPTLAVKRARDLVREFGSERLQQQIEEICAQMPPKPMMQESE